MMSAGRSATDVDALMRNGSRSRGRCVIKGNTIIKKSQMHTQFVQDASESSEIVHPAVRNAQKKSLRSTIPIPNLFICFYMNS